MNTEKSSKININKSYTMPKLSSGRRKKILKHLKLAKAPTKPAWGKTFKKKMIGGFISIKN